MDASGFDSTASPYALGQVTGVVVWSLLALIGALKCYAISKRPTTNSKCALGLMIFLLAYVPLTLLGCLRFIPTIPLAVRMVALFGSMAAMIAFVVASVLAIIGLIEINMKPGVYNQGRAQGIWTLILSGLNVFVFVGVVAFGIYRTQGLTRANSKPGQDLAFDSLNFHIRSPASPWVPLKASRINPIAKVAFMRQRPLCYFMIIAEDCGGDAELTTDQLAEIGKANLRSVAATCQYRDDSGMSVNGLRGLLARADVRVMNQNMHYCQWYFATNGFAYQLVAWGLKSDPEAVLNGLKEASAGFALTRPGLRGSGAEARDFDSVQYGFKVELAGSGWRKWSSVAQDFPEAECGFARNGCCLAVVPVEFDGEDLELEPLIAGMARTMNIEYPGDSMVNRQDFSTGGLDVAQFDCERRVQGADYEYRLEIARGAGRGYLVAAWGL
jgi:hypothetical protein